MQEFLHRGGEQVVGVVQQHIAAADHPEDALELLLLDRAIGQATALGPGQPGHGAALVRGVMQLGQGDADEAHQVIEPERSVDAVEVFGVHIGAFHQHLDDLVGHLIGHLEPNHFAAHAALAQPFLQGLHQVIGLEIPQFQVGVAGDPEEVVTLHGHAGEEQLQVEGHQLLQRHGGETGGGNAGAELGGDLHEARQDFLGHLHPGELLLTAVGIADQGRHVETEVAHERERVGRIDGQGRQHRKDQALEVVVGPGFLLIVQAQIIDQLHAVFEQLTLERMAVMLLLQFQQGPQFGVDGLQLFLGGEAVVAAGGDTGFQLGLEGGHPHHEEFVKVVAENGAELRLLQQRRLFVQRLGQDAMVEINPAQFAVDVQLRSNDRLRHGAPCSGRSGIRT